MKNKVRCLHICNDFLGSKVHYNLYTSLDKKGLNQTVYYQIRPNTEQIYLKNVSFLTIPSVRLKKYHRILFRLKIKTLFIDLKQKIELQNFDIIHATTLFTDGALAFKIYKSFNIPYILAVRGSDLNSFVKYRKDLIPLALKILKNASRIIFISNSLFKKFYLLKFIETNKNSFKNKSLTIENGIDSIWLKNTYDRKGLKPPLNILYVGNFNRNKNTLALVKSVLELKKEFNDIKITLVGEKGRELGEIKKLIKRNSKNIDYLGPIHSKSELMSIYRESDIFAMISISETFGLVYIEALSQGLPILCSKNQGVHGTFNKIIGEFVDPLSRKKIRLGLLRLIKNYSNYKTSQLDLSKFNWEQIANKYIEIYQIEAKQLS